MYSVIKSSITKDNFKTEYGAQTIFKGDLNRCKLILKYNYLVARIIFAATISETEVYIDYERYILKYKIE